MEAPSLALVLVTSCRLNLILSEHLILCMDFEQNKISYMCPGFATPILYARGIGVRTTKRTVFVKITSNNNKNKRTKKLGEDQIK